MQLNSSPGDSGQMEPFPAPARPCVPSHIPIPQAQSKSQGKSQYKSQRRWFSPARLFALTLVLGLLMPLMPAATPVAHAEDGVHVVAPGEYLSTIAAKYNVSMTDLIVNNGISNPNVVHVGQRLVIPGTYAAARYAEPAASDTLPGESGYVTVARGDSLSQIAKDHGMSMDDLMRLNGLSNPNFIWVGQQLRVSARVVPIASEPESTADTSVPMKAADTIYVVQAGDTLSEIAQEYNTTVQELLIANGLPSPNFMWVGQRIRIGTQAQPEPGLNPDAAPAEGYRWIEINLSDQTLTAWQGDSPVLYTSISSGTSATPTVTGRYSIGTKYTSQRMSGPGYDLPGVPWVMYFFSGYAIHGTYWHDNFGTPMSHGCINMQVDEAEFLYSWADAGTEVYVHY